MNHKKKMLPKTQARQELTSDQTFRFPLNQTKRTQSLLNIHQVIEQTYIRIRPSFMQTIWRQFQFQTWEHLAAICGVLLAAILFRFLPCNNRPSGPGAITACSVFLVFAGNICFSNVAHLFSHNMAELEKTLYYDLKQMVCIRMLEAAIAELLILILLAGYPGIRSDTSLFSHFLYLIVPFLWSDILYLQMLTYLRSIFLGFRQLSLGILCGVLALLPSLLKHAYEPAYVSVWAVLSAAGLLIFIAQIRSMLGKIDSGEAVC